MLDHFASGASPVHRLDPAAKTVAALAAVLATVLVGRGHFLPLVPVAVALAVYHALPYGLRDPIRQAVRPHLYVDVSAIMDLKRRALACHRSQRECSGGY